jgi:glycosyltransferase involved in cell wall biosynthesis
VTVSPPIRLSVVTVCWNDLVNVQRTMESIDRQTERQGWEHILVDGASSDGTAEWYRSADFSFPHVVVSEPDNGIFDAMNKALNMVNGDYVVFMNAGDQYADGGAIARTLRRLENNPVWGYSRARIVDNTGRKVRPHIGTIPYSRRAHLFGIGKICHQTVVMKLDFLRELGGFDPRMGNAADYHLLIKAASRVPPATWTEVDVDYLAGGVSDAGVYDQLWLGHRSRADALGLKSVGTQLDKGWTALQVIYIRTRKRLKPMLGSMYLRLRG